MRVPNKPSSDDTCRNTAEFTAQIGMVDAAVTNLAKSHSVDTTQGSAIKRWLFGTSRGALSNRRGPDRRLAVAKAFERLQISAAHELDKVEAFLVPAVVIGVEHGGGADVEAFVAEQPHVVHIHFGFRGMALAGVANVPQRPPHMKLGIGPTGLDVFTPELLVQLVGVEESVLAWSSTRSPGW